MVTNVNFDALARKSNESGSAMKDLNNLFGATFALEKWLFIARGELPNVNPYIAANADYADGQQMIRGFTDATRLQRFAKENNLTAADGSAQMLEIPTAKIVDYLEGFIQYGVHGVWFNSDRQSDGYFIPLKQLRPIKEHLANTGWKSVNEPTNPDLPHNSGFVPPITAQNTPMEVVTVIVNDGLMLPSGFTKAQTYASNFYCLVPTAWTENGKMKDAYLEKLFEQFYGANWRNGNEDGSQYLMETPFSNVLTSEFLKELNWTEDFKWIFTNDEKNYYWHYTAGQDGEFKKASPEEFQKAFNESRKISAAPAQPSSPSNLANFGLSQTPDGEPDLRIKLFKQGNVKFGTSLVPFYAAIILLLRDYQGFGDFKFIFTFIPEAMKNVTENFPDNDHGKYFRVRKFQYHPPDGKAVSDIQTIDSNELRHIQTGATLSMSFALVQLLDDTAASLYFGFEGGSIEVKKLLKAIAPALEAAGFVDDKTENDSPAQSAAVDENAVDYIDWFRRGTVKPDTSFKPFFQAIAPLLADYAGTGDFEFSFATGSDEPGMRDLFEDISSNSHGAYLKYRSYIFEPYEMQMIGSNRLTNVRTGEKLRIQLTMHKNLADQKTTLIVVFVGRSATVETLDNAVKSVLDDTEYKVQLKLKKAATTDTLQSIGVQE